MKFYQTPKFHIHNQFGMCITDTFLTEIYEYS